MKLYEWIRKTIRETPGLTQRGLAKAMGMNPATVNRMLYGRRHIRAEEVPQIEAYLGRTYAPVSKDAGGYAQDTNDARGGAFSDSARPSFGSGEAGMLSQALIPVYHGNGTSGAAVDWVERHPQQKGSRDAYAVYIVSGEYEPRYYSGELVYIHPGKPPAVAQDCLVETRDGTRRFYRYAGQSQQDIRVSELQNGKDVVLPQHDVAALCAVVGRG
ncbi:MAG: XRE family transcriptional regulator [Micavibrio sp.]|nr:MAG: XRE family transcriptional regulator [Micavibrio sp.]